MENIEWFEIGSRKKGLRTTSFAPYIVNIDPIWDKITQKIIGRTISIFILHPDNINLKVVKQVATYSKLSASKELVFNLINNLKSE